MVAPSAIENRYQDLQTVPVNASTLSLETDEPFAVVLGRAFEAGKKEDAANITRSIKAFDNTTGDTISDEPYYIICNRWMSKLMEYLKGKDEALRPGKIVNLSILEIATNAMTTNKTNDGMKSSEESSDSNGGYVVVSSPLQAHTLEINNGVGVNDKGRNSWAEITRENKENRKKLEDCVIRQKMTHNSDYVLVGKSIWSLLSAKFGFDASITFIPRVLSGNPSIVVYPDILNNGDQPSFQGIVPIPETGMFSYDMPSSDNDLVSEDDAQEDDLFPHSGDFENTETSVSPPLILLPPSTTSTSLEERSDEMLVDKREISNNTKKRKRYGAGLGNLGNTCFMNSTLQCLAHTGPIRQYFLSGEYLNDLNRDNPLGTGGELASEFATLLSQMWGTGKSADAGSIYGTRTSYNSYSSNSYGLSGSVVYPRSFKSTLGKHAEQFMGYNQHDSQELATYLLDALHEDTNRVSKKPYVEKPEQRENESDDEAAEKAWGLHLKRENSRVLESFMGQVKSRVECPREHCRRISTTFDPFMYLSVPLPGATDRTLDVSFVPLTSNGRRQRLKVNVTKTGTIADLRNKVVEVMNTKSCGNEQIDMNNLVITDFYNNEVFSYLNDEDEIDKIRDNDITFVFELPSLASIHLHGSEIDKAKKKDRDEENHGLDKRAEDLLDLATIARLNNGEGWHFGLEKYLVQPMSLTTLLNQRRGSHEDRMCFHQKATKFLCECYSCIEFETQTTEKSLELSENQHKKIKSSVSDIDLQSSRDDESDDIDCTDVLSPTSEQDKNQQSLSTLCESSIVFHDVKTVKDVATLEFCLSKFYEFSKEELKLKYEKFRDGIEIQVILKKRTRMYTSMQDKIIGSAFMIRIPPNITVFEFRKVLASRLASVLSSKASDEVRSLRQVALSYEKKSMYNTYSKSSAYRKLGSISKLEDENSPLLAMPEHDAEQETILDIVGHRGKVNIHWPQDLEEFLDENEWEKVEDITSPSKEDEETATQIPSVVDCITKYCQIEQLEESEMWYCNKCKDHVRAWKQFHLYRTPPILIVHLKRFHYSSLTHRRDKIDTFIDFPLRGLDLTQEVTHWPKGEEPIYDCYAVSNHYGGLGGGHYTAYALNDNGEWCYFDDSRVTTEVEESEVISAAAYVLYYRRRDVKIEDEAWSSRALPLVSKNVQDQNSSKNMDVDESGGSDLVAYEEETCTSPMTSIGGAMSTEGASDEDMDNSCSITYTEKPQQ